MLKKLSLLTFAILLSSSFISAQNPLRAGVYRVGGGISFSSGTTEDKNSYDLGINNQRVSVNFETKNISFSFRPSFSYFVTGNILIGGSIGFDYLETKRTTEGFYSILTNTINNTTTSKDIFRIFNIGPLLRYYFDFEKIIPFIGAGASYVKYIGEDFVGKNFYGEIGVNYFIASNAAFEPYLSYTISSAGSSDNSNKDSSVGIGFIYYIIP